MFKNKKRKGFTIIEVLIVVIIIGILAALVVPRMLDATQQARESTARAQHRTVLGQINVEIAANPTIDAAGMWTQLTRAFGATAFASSGDTGTLTKGTGTNQIVTTIQFTNTTDPDQFTIATTLGGSPLATNPLNDTIVLP